MKDEQQTAEEAVPEVRLKEYPRFTRWMEGQQIIGVGNLLLTTERLVFLHRFVPTKEQIENFQKLSEGATTTEIMDFALTLHKKNFQIPLSLLILAKVGLQSMLPFPRFCLRISYRNPKKKKQIKTTSFMFTIPLLRGFFQLEITTVWGWSSMIRRAMRTKQFAMDKGDKNIPK